jgi:hypothetical protein
LDQAVCGDETVGLIVELVVGLVGFCGLRLTGALDSGGLLLQFSFNDSITV